jgi:hypothetical protein
MNHGLLAISILVFFLDYSFAFGTLVFLDDGRSVSIAVPIYMRLANGRAGTRLSHRHHQQLQAKPAHS